MAAFAVRKWRITSGGIDLLHAFVFSKSTSRRTSPVARMSTIGYRTLSTSIVGGVLASGSGSVAAGGIGRIVRMWVDLQVAFQETHLKLAYQESRAKLSSILDQLSPLWQYSLSRFELPFVLVIAVVLYDWKFCFKNELRDMAKP